MSQTFTEKLTPKLLEYLASLSDRDAKVIDHASPSQISAALQAAGTPLEVTGGTETDEVLLKACDVVLKYSVRTGHPHFANQLFARADDASVAAEWLLGAVNTTAYTYEAGPVFTLVEREVLRAFAKVCGWPAESQGLSVPGGSIANMYGLLLARAHHFPQVLEEGMGACGPLCIFVSDQSHYSFLKSVKVLGMGSKSLIQVKTDAIGRMRADELKKAIAAARKAGKKPFFVGATAGTTVLGAMDPLDELAQVCKDEDLWMHVDGCWGGSLVLSPQERHAMKGIERADSFAWNPHKMMGCTLQTCVFITRHEGMLAKTNATKAAYLFQPDKEYTNLDVGDWTIQCGRRPDLFKLWVLWKRVGDKGLAARVDQCCHLARDVARRVRMHPNFQLVYEPSCANVCFWWVPPELRPFDLATATQEQRDLLHKAAAPIKKEMQRLGQAMIGFQSINDMPNFFRLVFATADAWTDQDTERVMRDLDAAGASTWGLGAKRPLAGANGVAVNGKAAKVA